MKETNSVKDAVKAYLDKRAKEDPLFAVTYAKENKSFDECFSYVMGEMLKASTSVYQGVKGCHMDDDVVFGMAVHYYDEDDIKVNKLPANVKATASISTDKPKAKKEKAPEPQPAEVKAEVKSEAPKLKAKQKKEEGVEQLSIGF